MKLMMNGRETSERIEKLGRKENHAIEIVKAIGVIVIVFCSILISVDLYQFVVSHASSFPIRSFPFISFHN